MKKKAVMSILAGIMIMSLGTIGVSAANKSIVNNYVDKNNDGLCDNYGSKPNFVDEDGDGICDNKVTDITCPKYGMGRKLRQGNMRRNANFTDVNNDGICDNRGSGYGRQNGCCSRVNK